MDKNFDTHELQNLVYSNSIIAANGYGNEKFKALLATLENANTIRHGVSPVNNGIARSPLEKMVLNFVLAPDLERFTNVYGLKVKSVNTGFPHFYERFNSLTFNLGRGLSTEQKLKSINSAGFTQEAIQFESELIDVFNQLQELINELDRTKHQRFSRDNPDLQVLKRVRADYHMVPHGKGAHSSLKNAFMNSMAAYLEAFEDNPCKERLLKSIALAFDYAAAADDDLYLLNAITNDSTIDNLELLSPYVKSVTHYRQNVLLHAAGGLFSLEEYVNYFYGSMLAGETTDYSNKVLLPVQYVFHSVMQNVDKLPEPNISAENLALYVAIILHFDRLLKRDNNNAGQNIKDAIVSHGVYGAFSLDSRM